MNRASISGISLLVSLIDWPPLRCQNFGVGDKIAVNARGQLDGDFYALILRELCYFQLRHLRHPRYGSSTRSRLTITRTGNPGRIVRVGWMLRFRRTTCCPV